MPEIAVVGGGPAGLIAAETLANNGAAVTVYEHKRSVGRKFLLAGRGGLNITHAEPLEELLQRYGERSDRLEGAIRAFAPADLRAWCEEHDEATFVGTSDRVFPKSFRATPLLRSWLDRLLQAGVSFQVNHRWVGWSDGGHLRFETAETTKEVAVDAAVFALGGASWPRVGSDGAWIGLFEDAGVLVAGLQAANCGVQVGWTSHLVDRFAGDPIKNTVFTVGDVSVRGDAIISSRGLEGGPIYGLGPALRAEFAGSAQAGSHQVVVHLDTHPDLTVERLADRLSKRRAGASITSWLNSAGVAAVVVALTREATHNNVPQDPSELARLLKSLPVQVQAMEPVERAISTAGGVSFDAVDKNWMLINKPGNFVCGEMLDWEAPTGGYLLQACFSTGVAAAHGVLAWVDAQP